MRPQQAPAVTLVVDTSERAYGGFVRGGSWQFSKEFKADELARVERNEHSSTVRELYGSRLALCELLDTCPALIPPGSLVQIWGNSLSAISAAQRMHGKAVFCHITELHVAALRHGIRLHLVWSARESEGLQVADALSKTADPTVWRLSRQMATTAVRKHAPRYAHLWPPELDLCASSQAHQCDRYMASIWTV
jgi:hypothetical protein